MEELLTQGNTPFEIAQRGRKRAQLLIATHCAVKELVEQIDECEKAIMEWSETFKDFTSGCVTKEELEVSLTLATQALKDKKLFETALQQITEVAAQEHGLEA